MDHVFIYALPTGNARGARILEISAVHASGFGPYRKVDLKRAYTGKADGDPKGLLTEMRERIIPGNPFVVVSYCNDITRALLRNEYELCGLEDMFSGRAWVDVNQLAWPMMATGEITMRTLPAIAKFFGVACDGLDSSSDTCSAIIQLYGLMMRRYRTALAAEGFAREMGGETLEGIRKIVGF